MKTLSVFVGITCIFYSTISAAQTAPSTYDAGPLPTDKDIAAMQSQMDATAAFLNTVKAAKPTTKADTPLGGQQRSAQPISGKPYDILIFVSSSMPEAEIRNYSKQAKSFGATLVLRGFVHDKSSDTRAFITALNAEGGSWMIHPEAFKLFKVEKVPSIVLADATNKSLTDDGCAQETAYTKVSGDITLDAALDLFSRRAEPTFANLSKKLIAENRSQYEQKRIISK